MLLHLWTFCIMWNLNLVIYLPWAKIEPIYVNADKISICEFLAYVNVWFSMWLILWPLFYSSMCVAHHQGLHKVKPNKWFYWWKVFIILWKVFWERMFYQKFHFKIKNYLKKTKKQQKLRQLPTVWKGA